MTPVSFVGRDAKNSCFIYSNIFQWFSTLFYYIQHRFFVPFFLSYKQLLKNTRQLYKICYREAYVPLTGFKYLILKKKAIRFICKWLLL